MSRRSRVVELRRHHNIRAKTNKKKHHKKQKIGG